MRRIAPGCDESHSPATYENRILTLFQKYLPEHSLSRQQRASQRHDQMRRIATRCDESDLLRRIATCCDTAVLMPAEVEVG
jgi:hypothetical protein